MKDFKGSSHRGQYHGNYADERIWDGARSSVDEWTVIEKEDLECAVAMSLSEQDQKGKNVIEEDKQLAKALQESYPFAEDEQLAKALQESCPLEEDELLAKALQESCPLEEDELFAKAVHESLLESPPQYGICAGCNTEISPGKILRRMDAIWHAECFRCHACNLPIKDREFSKSGKHRYHKSCRKKPHSPICDVCKNFISRGPRMADNQFIDMITEPRRLIRRCEVTAILVLYGLPRLLTGSILAHEMMHAWLRLKGYPNLSPEVEEGICQVLAHMWMESEILSASGSDVASSSSSSSPSSSSSSKKGKRSEFEKKLGEFFKHQIETDETSAYGDGFRKGNEAVLKYGLETTLTHIRLTKNFPY
nr:protein da1-related 1 [Quercus suber]